MTPKQLGPYTIVKRLGRGGMGAVYEGLEPTTGRSVAVKMLASHLADDPGLRRRFFAEIETLKSLEHPSIVRLLAFGEEDGHPYFAMELVRGESLEHRLRGGDVFGWRKTVEVATLLAKALKAAHDRGIVHRDLKPANVLLAEDGSAKLADFGIAKLFGGVALTAHGSVVGTAEYMAPEQASGQPTDHRVDLYALGAVMFAMLVGHPPFRGSSLAEIMEKQRRNPAPRVSGLVFSVPKDLDELIDRLLSKDPAKRPATALVLVRLLETIVAVEEEASSRTTGIEATIAMTAHPEPPSPAVDRTILDATEIPDKHAVDLLAPTRDLTVGIRTPTHVDDPSPQPRTGSTTQVDSSRHTRFTTVEHLERVAREREERAEARRARLRLVGAIAVLAGVGAGGYLLFRPPSADALYARITQAARDGGDLRGAEPWIADFLERHPTDPRAPEIQTLADTLSIDALERSLRRSGRKGEGITEAIERDYLSALDRIDTSPSAGLASLEAIQVLHRLEPEDGEIDRRLKSWQALVRRQIDRLRPLADAEGKEDAARIDAAMAEADAAGEKADVAIDAAAREALLAQRRRILEAVVAAYGGKPHARDAVARANRMLEAESRKEPTP